VVEIGRKGVPSYALSYRNSAYSNLIETGKCTDHRESTEPANDKDGNASPVKTWVSTQRDGKEEEPSKKQPRIRTVKELRESVSKQRTIHPAVCKKALDSASPMQHSDLFTGITSAPLVAVARGSANCLPMLLPRGRYLPHTKSWTFPTPRKTTASQEITRESVETTASLC
jgi:hypothetical protein